MTFLIVFAILAILGRASADTNANHYCADLNPQPHVDIEQLMGMWYGVELITHRHAETQRIRHDYEDSCIVMYLSEDKTTTTISPLHQNYNYGETYGSAYGTGYQGIVETNTDPSTNPTYDTDSSKANYQDGWTRYGAARRPFRVKQKRLQLLWDENGSVTEYSVYYTSKASVWFSSGPQNGSSLAQQYNHFAGVIQVIKAVGNHLVLTFCHRLPDEKLYTVLLSRVPRLSKSEIHGVHNLLSRRGLETLNVRKVCSHNVSSRFGLSAILSLSTLLLIYVRNL